MGIISRFVDIMSANINALLDKCEDPEKMIDEYMYKLTGELADVKKETAAIMAEETRAVRALEENKAQVKKYDDLARKALQAGNEDDARVFLGKKQRYEAETAGLEKTCETARANAQKMRDMHDKLVSDIEQLKSRRAGIKAKVAVAKAQERVNRINSSVDTASGTISAFERMEQKADRMLDEANAMSELNAAGEADADLEKKYAGAASDASVEDELARLKAEMGL